MAAATPVDAMPAFWLVAERAEAEAMRAYLADKKNGVRSNINKKDAEGVFFAHTEMYQHSAHGLRPYRFNSVASGFRIPCGAIGVGSCLCAIAARKWSTNLHKSMNLLL